MLSSMARTQRADRASTATISGVRPASLRFQATVELPTTRPHTYINRKAADGGRGGKGLISQPTLLLCIHQRPHHRTAIRCPLSALNSSGFSPP